MIPIDPSKTLFADQWKKGGSNADVVLADAYIKGIKEGIDVRATTPLRVYLVGRLISTCM